jgi:GT2 family glycosyltransferase
MRATLIVPNYNGEALLPSVLSRARPAFDAGALEVIVCDDASTDGSVPLLKSEFPWVNVSRSQKNRGFGPTCNRGAREASGEYLVFVNTDVEFEPASLEKLISRLGPGTFAVMPLVMSAKIGRFENLTELWVRRGLAWLRATERTKLLAREYSAGRPLASEAFESVLCGAMFAVRRSDFLALGGFDEAFAPFYFEDVDLSVRANRAGKKVMATADAVVRHMGSQTIGGHFDQRRITHTMLKNQILFTLRHADYLPGLRWFRCYFLARSARWLVAGRPDLSAAYLRGVFSKVGVGAVKPPAG